MANMVDPRQSRRRRFRLGLSIAILACLGAVVFAARALILPCLVAAILAYLCKPLVYNLRRKGMTNWLAVTGVTLSLFIVVVTLLRLAISAIPEGTSRLELRARTESRLNKTITRVLRLDDEKPHWIYQNLHAEIDYLLIRVNSQLRLNPSEVATLTDHLATQQTPEAEKLAQIVEANLARERWRPSAQEIHQASVSDTDIKAHLNFMLSSVSLWLLLPIVLIFLLGDDGSIFRFAMSLIPNTYFELTLTMLERVDKALGHYLRGTALECAMVGACIAAGLVLFGVDVKSALLIGLISGITNAIPFFGTVIGCALGLAYAMMYDDIQPLLPFLTGDDLLWGVFAIVGVAHLLDNAIFQPLLIGKAVNLHPLAVVLAVAVGGVGFGMVGILIAIPTLVVTKTCLETLVTGLRDYRLI